MGGYDIYRVKGAKSSWEIPENMKAPFNTGADDMGLILKRNGYEGYLASNRPGGMGNDDIYYFADPNYFERFRRDEAPPQLVVTDHSKPQAGIVQPNPVKKTHTAEEVTDKQKLEEMKFLYDYNSASLLTMSRRILDEVASVLKRHPDWKVVISSFADNRGSDQYNTDLSALRCYAVIDYLANKGIDPKRLYYSNRGEHDPVNGCKDGVPCKEEEYRQNRRSELKVKW